MANELPLVEAIFHDAVAICAPQERAAFLDGACGLEPDLRRRVEALLQAHDGAEDVLRLPTRTPDDFPVFSEAAGSTIGRYKLLEQIGEGGFGVVFMAEQTHPVRRKVALKVIKPGVDTRQVIARFEAERQALALMEHENIAKVLDAGATEFGRPYFVMELVHGVPITEYCDKNELAPRQRLELFVQVCRAVQHAHTKGIIHRDIKPTNVLVTLHEGVAVPKVIDFGVAKATGQQLTDKTLFTNFAQMVGTPLYMSPEQAEMTGIDVDTRSDVYSLGVLLYELLTGTTPLDKERMKQAAFDEVRRIIREEEPPRPSTRLSTMGEAAQRTISSQRKSDPKHLGRIVRGELDWIVMKALEKDRARRYETANGLARDVERYLHDEAVHACPPSAAYRFRKFARRNRLAVMTAFAVVAGLVLLVAVLTISNRMIAASNKEKAEALRQKELALDDAEAERRRAEDNFSKAGAAVRDLLTSPALASEEWAQLPPSLRKKFQEEAAKYYASLLQGSSPDPSLRYETAVGLRSLGYLHHEDDPARAEAFLRQAIGILEPLQRDGPPRLEYRQQLQWSHLTLSVVLQDAGRPADADAAAQRCADLCGASSAERREAADWYRLIAAQRIRVDRISDAAALYCRALELYTDSHDTWYQAATLHLASGDVERYRRGCREMLDRFDDLATAHPDIAARTAMACVLAPDAVPDWSRVEQIAHRSLTGTEAYRFRGHYIVVRGLAECRIGRYEQALEWLHRAGPDIDGNDRDSQAFAAMAIAHHHLGRAEEARESLGVARAIIDRESRDSRRRPYPFWVVWLHAEILAREAETLIGVLSPQECAAARQRRRERELADLSGAIGENPAAAEAYKARGTLFVRVGRFREAAADLRKVSELDPHDIHNWYRLAAACLRAGEAERYRGACRALLERAETVVGANVEAAEWAVKTAALAPDAMPELSRVERLAQRLVTATEDDALFRSFVLAKGLADHRAARPEQAIDWLQKFAPTVGGTHQDATAFAALALAHHRLGHLEQARGSLDSAREIISNKPSDAMRDAWVDWLHCEILYREAQQLLAK